MCSDENNYNKHLNGRKHKNMVKRLGLQQGTGTEKGVARAFKFSKMGFNTIDEVKQISNEKKKELEKILEDEDNMISKTDRKLAQQLLDPTTPYVLELVNCMKSKDPEGALDVYKEMKHRQIEATAHMCNMVLQLVCTVITDKREGREFQEELTKQDESTNDLSLSKFREIGSEIASKLCVYSEDTEKEAMKAAAATSKSSFDSLVTVYSLIIRFYASIGDIDNAVRQLQKIRQFARHKIVHRMYFPIISNHPSRNVEDLQKIMSLFMDGINEPNMTFDKETDYMTMLGKINAVYKATTNETEPGTFRSPIREVLREMENNVSKVSPTFIEYLQLHMGTFLQINTPPEAAKASSSELGENNVLAKIGNNGICPCCSTQLDSIDLKKKRGILFLTLLPQI